MIAWKIFVLFQNCFGHGVQRDNDGLGVLLDGLVGDIFYGAINDVALGQTHHISDTAANVALENKDVALRFQRRAVGKIGGIDLFQLVFRKVDGRSVLLALSFLKADEWILFQKAFFLAPVEEGT